MYIQESVRAQEPRAARRLGYRRIVQLLVFLVVIPTVLILLVGIVLMFLGSEFNFLFGLLTVAFVLVAVTGIVLVLVFLRREAKLSTLQADFVSKVSHELRTPLTSIRLFVETMDRSRSDAATVDKCIDALGRETERLTLLIERLLDWGRMEAGRKQFELHDHAVQEVIAKALEASAPLRDRHADLDFTSEVEPGLPKVHADLEAMADAILNLLSNALKYGGSPPVVRLRARRFQDRVAIEVSDNGDGIPRVEHRRIFDKFYRIDDRLSREREGSGLGLAIVKHISRVHRGKVQVESAAGKGSTFRILLLRGARREQVPVDGAARRAKSAGRSSSRDDTESQPMVRSGAVLVVEDDASIMLGLRINLEAEGYVVLSAEDGERGLALAREERPDVIILDVMLPKLNGLQVLQTAPVPRRADDADHRAQRPHGRGRQGDRPRARRRGLRREAVWPGRAPCPRQGGHPPRPSPARDEPPHRLHVRRRARRRVGAHGDARRRARRDDGDGVRICSSCALIEARGTALAARRHLRPRMGPSPSRYAAHGRQFHPAAPSQSSRGRPPEAEALADGPRCRLPLRRIDCAAIGAPSCANRLV